jgi:hypothetical protein
LPLRRLPAGPAPEASILQQAYLWSKVIKSGLLRLASRISG